MNAAPLKNPPLSLTGDLLVTAARAFSLYLFARLWLSKGKAAAFPLVRTARAVRLTVLYFNIMVEIKFLHTLH